MFLRSSPPLDSKDSFSMFAEVLFEVFDVFGVRLDEQGEGDLLF